MKPWRNVGRGLFLAGVAIGGAISVHASQFLLLDLDFPLGYGPYEYADGTLLHGVPLEGLVLGLTPGGAVFCHPEAGDVAGPVVPTNGMTVTLGERKYRFSIVGPDFHRGYAEGLQTREFQNTIALVRDRDVEPTEALERVRQAQATNPLARITRELEAFVGELQTQVEEEKALRAAGKVKYEGRWMTREEARMRYRRRVEEEQRKRGLVLADGTWMTPAAAEEHRKKIAATEAGEKCARCNGTGFIHYEYALTPRSLRGTKPLLNRRFEKAGAAPANSARHSSTQACPDCGGCGRRKQ